jgi:hypothetical protein
MSRSKRTGSTQKVGSGSRHISGKSPNTPTRKGKEAEMNPRELWRPKFKELPESCASCPFKDGNDSEFEAVMQKLADANGLEDPVSVHESRGRIRAETEHLGDFRCHGSVYDREMGMRPQAEHRQCPGASAYFKAAGLRAIAKLKRRNT